MTTITDINGCPEFEGRNGNNNRDLAAPGPAFAQELRLRASCRLREPPGYRDAIADYLAHEARRRPASGAGRTFEADARWLAAVLAGLIVLGVILGVGCKAARAVPPAVSKHTDAIAAQVVD
jgi:hypothetical protein